MERATLLGLRALKARGHQVHFLSLHPMGALAPLLDAEGIGYQGLPYRGPLGLLGLSAIKRAATSWRPDAILQTGHNVAAARAIQGLCRGHRVLSCHFHHEPPAWRWRLIYKQALAVYDRVTFNSHFSRDEALSMTPALANRSEVLVNPYEVPALVTRAEREQARKALGLPAKARVIGNAGWLIPRKRWDVFIQVLARLQGSHPTWAVVAGDGPEGPRLKALAAELGVADRIKWLGWREDLREVYAAMDVLLFNSDVDAMGNTPIEAVASGTPAVCSVRAGGLGELFDMIAGLQVRKDHDVEALTGSCEAFFAAPAKGRAAARRLRGVLASKSDPKVYARHLEALLGLRPC